MYPLSPHKAALEGVQVGQMVNPRNPRSSESPWCLLWSSLLRAIVTLW